MEYHFFYDPQEVTLIQSDLAFLYSIKGQSKNEVHNRIFGSDSEELYRSYLEDRIKVIRRSLSGSNSYAFVDEGYRNTLALTSLFFKLPQIVRVAVIIHEARHGKGEADQEYWPHVDCPDPYLDEFGNEMLSAFEGNITLSGKKLACDLSAEGAFGATASMLKNVSQNCESCDSATKQRAYELYLDVKARVVDPKERSKL